MQRDTEQAAQLSPSSEDEALVLRQKPSEMPADEEDSTALHQWKARQLQRLAEELKAEWQEARLQQVRQAERLYLAHLLDETAERSAGNDSSVDERNQRGTAKHTRAKERNRAAFREERGRREEHPRQHPKSRKKAPCSERRSSAKARGPASGERGKGRRVSSSKSHGGYQGPRVTRRVGVEKLNPFFDGETDCMEEVQKEFLREGRRPSAKGTHNLRDQSLQGKTAALTQPLLLGPTCKQEAAAQGPPSKYNKNLWHKEIESTFEELFNTNRKLKKHLSLHLEQRLKAEQSPDEQQSCSETRSGNFGTLREETTEEVETAEASGSPTEVETPEMYKANLKQILSDTEYPRYQQIAKYPLKSESLVPVKAGTSREQDDLFSLSPESGQEPPKSPAVEDESLKPYLQKQADSVASWMALRQKQKAELEQRRQKTLLELTEHPNMSLEIHYKAELEEERRERRRMRLALLKSNSTGIRALPPDRNNLSLDNGLLDEDKQNQMIRDLQQQILEQNKLHQEFLEKARKRLQEFQKSF
ncbi:protein DDC8 homolog [Mus pahari]|uniref:protein DDC8 homolog n=1 Tax=Mus pahari TaxID=10093 RepID=UPI000A30DF99|nr:protein DDC8 homolog [Mus pahari]XP_021067988.1 protein DDC8 homolog [Mus pahari]